MTLAYYNPWRLGLLTEHVTVALTDIEKLDKSCPYIVTTNVVLTEQQDINEPNFEVDWTAFYQKHSKETFALEIQTTDSILMSAREGQPNREWKWRKYGQASWTSKDIINDEFTQKIQHEGKVLVVTSVLCGGYRRLSNGHIEEVGCNKEIWNFEEEDKTNDIVNEISHCLDKAFSTYAIGDEFYQGLEYVVKNIEEIQRFDHLSQIKLVRMGYEELADGMGQFSHALRSTAERGTTVFYGSADNLRP